MLRRIGLFVFVYAFLFTPAGHAEESSSPHPKEFLIESFPKGLTRLDEINGEYILRLGKCCDLYGDTIEFLPDDQGEITLMESAGFEVIEHQIKEYTTHSSVHKLRLKLSFSDEDTTLSISPLPKHNYLFKLKGSFVYNSSSRNETIWVDNRYKDKIKTIIEDDCPPPDEAC